MSSIPILNTKEKQIDSKIAGMIKFFIRYAGGQLWAFLLPEKAKAIVIKTIAIGLKTNVGSS
jgi:hypothetical protein